MLKRDEQCGFTLIELMIAALLGLFVILAVTGVFISTYQANSQNLKVVRMDGEMRAAMTLMARDIRRSGLWENAMESSFFGNPNNFASDLNWSISRFPGEPANSCVTFAYDKVRQNVGVLGDDELIDPTDLFGYRLNAGTIETRTTGTACNGGGWQDITDGSAWGVTDLNFTTTLEPGAPGVGIRTVIVTLEGAVNTRASDPTLNDAGAALTTTDCAGNTLDIVCRRLIEKVRMRNDAILP